MRRPRRVGSGDHRLASQRSQHTPSMSCGVVGPEPDDVDRIPQDRLGEQHGPASKCCRPNSPTFSACPSRACGRTRTRPMPGLLSSSLAAQRHRHFRPRSRVSRAAGSPWPGPATTGRAATRRRPIRALTKDAQERLLQADPVLGPVLRGLRETYLAFPRKS